VSLRVADHISFQTYLAGESFAGQYIPYFGKPTDLFFLKEFFLTDHSSLADALLKSQAFPNYPLKGIAIGNGWIDPKTQYQGYVDFAYEKGLIKQGSKVGLRHLSHCEPNADERCRNPKHWNNICSSVRCNSTSTRIQQMCQSMSIFVDK
jgi:carboxypeptidase C (cathepsin A)